MRILWSFARPHTGTLALGLLLALLSSALGLATPMVTKWVLDALDESASLTGPVLTLLGLFAISCLVGYWQWVLMGTLGERVVLEARESMVRRLLRATVPAVTRRAPGELVTRVTSDTVLLREAAADAVVGLINGTVMLVGTLVLMAVLDPVLLAATVTAVVLVGAVYGALMPGIANAQERAQDDLGRLGGVLEGMLRAIRTVKVSRAEHRTAERIVADARSSAAFGMRAIRRQALAWTISWSGVQIAIIVILPLGAWRAAEGQLPLSSLVAFLLYAFGLLDPIMELSQNASDLQEGLVAAERIRQVDELEVEPDPAPRPAAVRDRTARDDGAERPVLELRNVTAAYGPDAAPAVRGIDLVIPRRGHVAIVGPSGAGKTTLFSLILRFLEPQGGEMLLDGRPYRDLTHDEIRSRLAYVEQDTPIVPGTIRDNLLFSHPEASEEEIGQVLAAVRLDGKVESLPGGLDTPLSGTTVSGGERQRIALARALLRTPDVLLLDEATAQLDGLTEAAVHDCVRARADSGAVVTIAHRLSTVIDADTIVVLEDGRVRARGSHEELLAADALYRELVEALRIADRAPSGSGVG
ncbi:ABC transporter ATP-binding protein [Actinomadura keratinilytica]|uniref:ABC transporter ATP-binding protein n=1 Tax=Actinomadura keratinilytica TaxID=547461 RepID=A0ABP7YFW7_9ACTN